MTLDVDKISGFLKPKKPLDIFSSVSHYNAEGSGNKIAIRIISSSGYVIEGFPMTNDGDICVIYDVKKNSISYVDTKSIVVIEIKYEERVAGILTDDAYFEISNSDVPSRLQLNRNLKQLSEQCVQQHHFMITTQLLENNKLGEKERHQFNSVLEMIGQCIVKIAADDLGKVSLGNIGTMILGRTTEEFNVSKDSDKLAVNFNLSHKLDKVLEKIVIEQIEMNL
jgi:hypothetical protein